MKNVVNQLLLMINDSGYSAYLVGGYTRSIYLKLKENTDIDISTNAPLELLLKLFQEYSPRIRLYDTINFQVDFFNVDISHFRREQLIDGKLIVEHTNDIFEDAKRRDFTINSIYIDKDGKVIDFFNGVDDCCAKKLKFIGDCRTRIIEDPTRILRYIYFLNKYNFSPEYGEYNILKISSLDFIHNCSIFYLNKYFLKLCQETTTNFLKIFKEFNLYNFFFKYDVPFDNVPLYVFMAKAHYNYEDSLPKDIKEKIKTIRNIINYGNIDEKMIFLYGEELCFEIAETFSISKEYINRLFSRMPIKNISQLDFKKREIHKLIVDGVDYDVESIYNKVIDVVLNGNVANRHEDICNYIKENFQ